MDKLLKMLNDLIAAAQSFVDQNKILNDDLLNKIADCDTKSESLEKDADELQQRLNDVVAREKVCDSADELKAREDACAEKEAENKRKLDEYNALVAKHDQRMKDENSTLDARTQRLRDEQAALDKERTEYKDRIKKETVKSLVAEL